MNKEWFHVYNYSTYPAVSYGFAVDDKGVCVTAADKVSWMVGRHIDAIKKFFEGKPVDLNPVIPIKDENTSQDADTEVVGDVCGRN
jgi:hypothetical protein